MGTVFLSLISISLSLQREKKKYCLAIMVSQMLQDLQFPTGEKNYALGTQVTGTECLLYHKVIFFHSVKLHF